MMAINLAH